MFFVRRCSWLGAVLALTATSFGSSGCITLKADHDELAEEVAKLRKQVADEEMLKRAQDLVEELEAKLEELEEVLRNNQADLGLRVQNLEIELQELRGAAENADYQASAAAQELTEMRADLDARLQALEEKLNEATSIPENKTELYAEAEAQFNKRDYKTARRYWRTYESRYPEDPKMPDVKFNIGLTYFSERDYKSALGEFYRVIQQWPKSEVLPDALYYSGLAFAKLGQCKNAIAYFDALTERKTKAPASYKKKAKEQIAILKKDQGEICQDDKSSGRPQG